MPGSSKRKPWMVSSSLNTPASVAARVTRRISPLNECGRPSRQGMPLDGEDRVEMVSAAPKALITSSFQDNRGALHRLSKSPNVFRSSLAQQTGQARYRQPGATTLATGLYVIDPAQNNGHPGRGHISLFKNRSAPHGRSVQPRARGRTAPATNPEMSTMYWACR